MLAISAKTPSKETALDVLLFFPFDLDAPGVSSPPVRRGQGTDNSLKAMAVQSCCSGPFPFEEQAASYYKGPYRDSKTQLVAV
jgi:hypothetical protein